MVVMDGSDAGCWGEAVSSPGTAQNLGLRTWSVGLAACGEGWRVVLSETA